jgi:hypothetical protein
MIRVHRTECDGSAKKDVAHNAHVRALYSIGYLTAWTLGGWCGRDDKISQDNRHSLEKPPTSFQQVLSQHHQSHQNGGRSNHFKQHTYSDV